MAINARHSCVRQDVQQGMKGLQPGPALASVTVEGWQESNPYRRNLTKRCRKEISAGKLPSLSKDFLFVLQLQGDE